MKKILFLYSVVVVLIFVFAGGRCFSADYAFVPNSGDGTGDGMVSIIDTIKNVKVGDCNVGAGPSGVAVSPDGKYVYVTNSDDGTLSVIDAHVDYSLPSPDAPVSISVGGTPYGVAVSPDSDYVYVTNNSSDGKVWVIETETFTVAATIPVGAAPIGIAISPDGNYAYVANSGDNTISVIKASDYSVSSVDIDTGDVGYQPYGVAVSPSGSYVYITNSGKHNVTVIKTSDKTFSDINDASFNSPCGIAVSPDGVYVYVTNSDNATVSKINTTDTSNYSVEPITNTDFDSPCGLTLSPDGKFVYVANKGSGKVSVIDTTTEPDEVTGSPITVGSSPIALGKFIINIMNAPAHLKATVVSENQIDLSWSHTPLYGNQPRFQIERQISYGFYEIAKVKPGVMTYSDTGLRPGSTYTYRVTAYDDDGYSAYSNEAEAGTPSDDACFISTAVRGLLIY